MDKYVFFFFFVTMLTTNVTARNSVFGTIKDNTTWVLKKLSVMPAMTAYLQYEIHYPVVANRPRPHITFYYNGQDSPDLEEKCAQDRYGQLRNEDLSAPLNELYRKSLCYKDDAIWRCTFKTRIQDFEPKRYSFSLSYKCGATDGNLNGLFYNVTVYGESNKTNCVDLKRNRFSRIDRCERYYQYAAIPNQIGNTDLDSAMFGLTKALSLADRLLDLITHKSCLEEIYQIACLVVLPECLPEENKLVLPCREDCNKVLKDCLKMEVIKDLVDAFVFNCDYLPSKESNTSCYTKDDTCGPPPEVKHGHITGPNPELYFGRSGQMVEYACAGSMHMSGSANSTCLASGEWTSPPTCHLLTPVMIIGISIGGVTLLVLLITIAAICMNRYKQRMQGNDTAALIHNGVAYE